MVSTKCIFNIIHVHKSYKTFVFWKNDSGSGASKISLAKQKAVCPKSHYIFMLPRGYLITLKINHYRQKCYFWLLFLSVTAISCDQNFILVDSEMAFSTEVDESTVSRASGGRRGSAEYILAYLRFRFEFRGWQMKRSASSKLEQIHVIQGSYTFLKVKFTLLKYFRGEFQTFLAS